jgi:hypothetical protein
VLCVELGSLPDKSGMSGGWTLNYARHFVLFGCATAALIIFNRSHVDAFGPDYWSLGANGALHALSVAGAVRVRGRLGWIIGFVILAPLLSILSFEASLFACSLLHVTSLGSLLIAIAALGACGYVALIHYFLARHIHFVSLGVVVLFCVLGATLAYSVVRSPDFALTWITISWWAGCSLGLWAIDAWRVIALPWISNRGIFDAGRR